MIPVEDWHLIPKEAIRRYGLEAEAELRLSVAAETQVELRSALAEGASRVLSEAEVAALAPEFRPALGAAAARSPGTVAAWANLGIVVVTVGADVFFQYTDHQAYVQMSWLPREIAATTQLRRAADATWNDWLQRQQEAPAREEAQAKRDYAFFNDAYEKARVRLQELEKEKIDPASPEYPLRLREAGQLMEDMGTYRRRAMEAEAQINVIVVPAAPDD